MFGGSSSDNNQQIILSLSLRIIQYHSFIIFQSEWKFLSESSENVEKELWILSCQVKNYPNFLLINDLLILVLGLLLSSKD